MMKSAQRAAVIALAIAATFSTAYAQGADVIVGDLTGPSSYGSDDGVTSAFAIGTTSCNIGTAELLWIRNTNQHPVIGQNIYRVKDGVFEMVGVSWLKHGFTALQQNLCSPCNSSGTGSRLGVGCSDPYSSGLNGSQGGLGPRYEVNAATGAYPYPYTSPSYSGNDRRIRVLNSALDPATNAGATYIGEGHYVASDDSAAGNDENNASYRLMSVSGTTGGGFSMSYAGSTVREEPAIMAWPTINVTAQVVNQDIPSDGRVFLGFNAIALPNGNYRYVYAIHNLNSDRAVGGINIAMPNGHNSSNFEFRNTPWHSGELFSSTAWPSSSNATSVSWNTSEPYSAGSPWGSAVRWGSTYTVIFESDSVPGAVTLSLFKPGTPNSISFPAFVVPTPDWQSNSNDASMSIDGLSNDPFVGPIRAAVNYGTLSTVDFNGVAGAPFQVYFTPGNGVPNSFVTPGGEIVNLNLGLPLGEVFPSLQVMPGGGFQVALMAPNADVDIATQMAVLSPSAPDGIYLSACNEYDVRQGPTVVVTAEGTNSFNSTTTSGMWKITQTGNGTSPIASVTFTCVGGRNFDLDQTNMGGVTWCGATGGTYRNGTDAAVGVVYDAMNLTATCGNSGIIATAASTTSATWRFTDFDDGETFEFDIDTDNGPSDQGGASQAGMQISVTLVNGTTLTGTLSVNPGVGNGSIAELL